MYVYMCVKFVFTSNTQHYYFHLIHILDGVQLPGKVLSGLKEFYERRANERDFIEDTLIMGKDDGITVEGAKAYREKIHHGENKKKKVKNTEASSASLSQHSDEDMSDLYSSDDEDNASDYSSSSLSTDNSTIVSSRSDVSRSSYSSSLSTQSLHQTSYHSRP